jgi:hypothetical protein
MKDRSVNLPAEIEAELQIDRRRFFMDCGVGLGSVALATLGGASVASAAPPTRINPLAAKSGHFPARAKNVIYLFMQGGPSHIDLFEDKKALRKFHGDEIPPSYVDGVRFEQIREGAPKIMGSPWQIHPRGKCGAPMSDLLPHMSTIVDDLCFLRTVRTDESVHPNAQLRLFTGHRSHGRPSLGSWVTYGLGSESDNLPGFVAFGQGDVPQAHDSIHSSGFMSSVYHGVKLRGRGSPILNLENPAGVSATDSRRLIETVNQLNQVRLDETGDLEISARIAAYEMAARLQTSAPELMDFGDESQATLDLYGARADKPSFGRDCLMARRLVERGVRFVQLHYGDWDHHANIFDGLPKRAHDVDQGSAALVLDLKERGLLDDTLVIWGGEFGRTPVAQPQKNAPVGRDHHTLAFSMWMAGGGVKAGYSHGITDDLGMHAVEDEMHVHDLQATILHLLGLDHTRLTYRHQGRDFRLTDVYGDVVEKIFT